MNFGWQRSLVLDWVTVPALLCAGVCFGILVVGMCLPNVATTKVHRVVPGRIHAIWTALHDLERIAVSRGCSLVTRVSDTRWTEEMGTASSTVAWIETHAVKPIGFVRHGAMSDVPLTIMLEVDLVPCDGGVEVCVVEQTTVRDGSWKVPFLRVLVWCWPGFHSNDYLHRVDDAMKRDGLHNGMHQARAVHQKES